MNPRQLEKRRKKMEFVSFGVCIQIRCSKDYHTSDMDHRQHSRKEWFAGVALRETAVLPCKWPTRRYGRRDSLGGKTVGSKSGSPRKFAPTQAVERFFGH